MSKAHQPKPFLACSIGMQIDSLALQQSSTGFIYKSTAEARPPCALAFDRVICRNDWRSVTFSAAQMAPAQRVGSASKQDGASKVNPICMVPDQPKRIPTQGASQLASLNPRAGLRIVLSPLPRLPGGSGHALTSKALHPKNCQASLMPCAFGDAQSGPRDV